MADGSGWDEDAHPRGPDGKFGGGGVKSEALTWAKARAGGGSPKTAAAAREDIKTWANAKLGKKTEKPFVRGEVQKREWTDKQIAGKSKETWQDHYDAHPDKGGKPTAERAAMHEEKFIKPAFEGKKTAAEHGMKPVAILTMGGPASGKGTVLSKLKERGLDKSMFVHVDPDEVKGGLPEYVKSVPDHKAGTGGEHGNGTGRTYEGAAAQVHEESSHVAKQIEKQAIERGHNVIIDGTGANADKFVAKIKDLEARGYKVSVHYPHLDKEEGITRALARAEESGRKVPEPVIRDTYSRIESARDKIMSAAPNLTVYDGQNRHGEAYTKVNGKEPGHGRSPMVAVEKRRVASQASIKLRAKT